jgi:hypothetical protein
VPFASQPQKASLHTPLLIDLPSRRQSSAAAGGRWRSSKPYVPRKPAITRKAVPPIQPDVIGFLPAVSAH